MSLINDYAKDLPDDEKAALLDLWSRVQRLAPEAKEGIIYGIPAFRYKGVYLAGLAAYKNHLSFFPTSQPIQEFSDRLGDFETSKGSIHFTPKKPIPDQLVKDIIELRVRSIDKTGH